MAGDIREFYDLPIVWRPHPKGSAKQPSGTALCTGTLEESLAGAALTVAYNSNTGVDSVLAGVPHICLDRGAMAWDVAGHEIDGTFPTFDRSQWAYDLAYKQWLPHEFGQALDRLGL